MTFLTLQSQVDFTEPNPEDIVKYYVDRSNFFRINPAITKKMDVFYKKSVVATDDNPFKLFGLQNEFGIFEFYNRFQHDEPIEEDDV